MNNPNFKIKSCLIGLGNIGFKYDLKQRNQFLSHANTISSDSRFELTYAIDVNEENRTLFSENYPNTVTLDSITSLKPIDLAIIATPSQLRLSIIQEVIEKLKPKLILLEKPLALTMEEAKQILELEKQKNSPILVNYIRRFYPGYLNFQSRIMQNEFGSIKNILINYNRGLINCGSHFLDLVTFLTGKSIDSVIYAKQVNEKNYSASLKTSSDYLINIQASNYDQYNIGDITISFENAIAYIRNNIPKIEIYKTSGQFVSDKSEIIELHTEHEMRFLYDFIFSNWNKKAFSNSLNAYDTLNICQLIIDNAK